MLKKTLISLCFGALSILSQQALANTLYPGICEDQPIVGSPDYYHPATTDLADQRYQAIANSHSYTIVTDNNYWNDCTAPAAGTDYRAQDIDCPETSCLGHQ